MSTAPGAAKEGGPPKDVRIYHGYFKQSGMSATHFFAFQRAAADLLPGFRRGYPLEIAVRTSNLASLPWIVKDFPAKPVYIKSKTSKSTGLVTIAEHPKLGNVDEQVEAALKAGYLIVGSDGVARNENPETGARISPFKVTMSDLGQAGWKPEMYQVIHPNDRLPLVSDYDLLGVWPPDKATTVLGIVRDRSADRDGLRSAMATLEPYEVSDIVSPWADRLAKDINGFLAGLGKRPRIMHGAQDNYGDFVENDTTVVFLATQEIMYLQTTEAAKVFYAVRGRHTAVNPYGPKPENPFDPRPNAQVISLASRRGRG